MVKRKTLSLAIPIKVYNMLCEIAQITYSTKTKVVIDAIRKEYRIYKINTNIDEEDKDVKN